MAGDRGEMYYVAERGTQSGKWSKGRGTKREWEEEERAVRSEHGLCFRMRLPVKLEQGRIISADAYSVQNTCSLVSSRSLIPSHHTLVYIARITGRYRGCWPARLHGFCIQLPDVPPPPAFFFRWTSLD